MSKFVATVRWIALLPAAGWLGYELLAYAWMFMRGSDLNNYFIVRVCQYAATGVVMGGAYVSVGAYVAPSHKVRTAITLAIIAALNFAPAFAYVVMDGGTLPYWGAWLGTCILIGAGTAAIAIAIGCGVREKKGGPAVRPAP